MRRERERKRKKKRKRKKRRRRKRKKKKKKKRKKKKKKKKQPIMSTWKERGEGNRAWGGEGVRGQSGSKKARVRDDLLIIIKSLGL